MNVNFGNIELPAVATLVLACCIALPIALVCGASSTWGDRGPTWGELLGPLRLLQWPEWAAARYEFKWPVHRGIDRVYGLLVTETNEVVLVRHHRRDQHPYLTPPGGTIQPADESPADVVTHTLGPVTHRVEDWTLVDVERKAGHQELVYAARIRSADLDMARAATGQRLQTIPLSSEGLAHLELHPHGVARVLRQMTTEQRGPM